MIAVSKKSLKKGFIKPTGLQLLLKTRLKQIAEIRIIPKHNVYIVEAVYTLEVTTLAENNRIAAIDIGLNNLATVASNCPDFQPFIVCGKAVKACN